MGKKNHKRAIGSFESSRPSRCDQSKPIMMTRPGSQTTTPNLTISLDSYKRRKRPLDQNEDLQLCSQPLKVILVLKTFTGCNPTHKANLDWTLVLVVDIIILSFAVDQGIDANTHNYDHSTARPTYCTPTLHLNAPRARSIDGLFASYQAPHSPALRKRAPMYCGKTSSDSDEPEPIL